MKGGEGAVELAQTAMQLADSNPAPQRRFLYESDVPPQEKVRRVATEIYGAADVYFEKDARVKLDRFVKLGYGNLPVCIAKTQSSLSDNAKLIGAPSGFTVTVTDAILSAGAGFIVVVCGDIMLMPGLPGVPAAARMDIDGDGNITGLF
jgi:formate--tetrahydrofolate ligase